MFALGTLKHGNFNRLQALQLFCRKQVRIGGRWPFILADALFIALHIWAVPLRALPEIFEPANLPV